MVTGSILNLATILLVPISTLAVKRGYQLSNREALFYTFFTLAAAVLGCKVGIKQINRFGARKIAIASYWLAILTALFWIFAPDHHYWFLTFFPFLLGGLISPLQSNAMTNYFVYTVPKEQQVVSAMFIAIATGFFSGLAGMGIGALIFGITGYLTRNAGNPMTEFHLYYLIVLILLLPMSLLVYFLPNIPQSNLTSSARD